MAGKYKVLESSKIWSAGLSWYDRISSITTCFSFRSSFSGNIGWKRISGKVPGYGRNIR